MSFHVVVGTSASGIATARLLAESGERVRILSRRGGGPEHPLIEPIAADARDAARLTDLTSGATTLFTAPHRPTTCCPWRPRRWRPRC